MPPIILNSAEAIQTVKYRGEPRTIARLDVAGLVQQAQMGKGVIVMTCAVGDTVVEGTPLLQIHGAKGLVSEPGLMRTVHLEKQRTFDQDPKYALRLLVDIAIRLSFLLGLFGKGHLTMKSYLRIALAAATIGFAGSAMAAEVDMSKLTCKEVGALPAAKTIGVAMWTNGYVHGKAGNAMRAKGGWMLPAGSN